jgi:hypothetical protein
LGRSNPLAAPCSAWLHLSPLLGLASARHTRRGGMAVTLGPILQAHDRCDMVCYRIIKALGLHWLLGQKILQAAGPGTPNYRVSSARFLQQGPPRGPEQVTSSLRCGATRLAPVCLSQPPCPDHLVTSLVVHLPPTADV